MPEEECNFTNPNPYPAIHQMRLNRLAVVTNTPIIMHYNALLNEQLAKQAALIEKTASFAFLKRGIIYAHIWSVVFGISGVLVALTRSYIHNNRNIPATSVGWTVAISGFLFMSTISIFLPLVWIFALGMGVVHLHRCTKRSVTFNLRNQHIHNSGWFTLLRALWNEVYYSYLCLLA